VVVVTLVSLGWSRVRILRDGPPSACAEKYPGAKADLRGDPHWEWTSLHWTCSVTRGTAPGSVP
jgi:hypothetical protein